MAATLEAVPSTKTAEKKTEVSEGDAARELVRMAKEQGLSLTGPDGLLKQLTKTVVETALEEALGRGTVLDAVVASGSAAVGVPGAGVTNADVVLDGSGSKTGASPRSSSSSSARACSSSRTR